MIGKDLIPKGDVIDEVTGERFRQCAGKEDTKPSSYHGEQSADGIKGANKINRNSEKPFHQRHSSTYYFPTIDVREDHRNRFIAFD